MFWKNGKILSPAIELGASDTVTLTWEFPMPSRWARFRAWVSRSVRMS